MHNEVLKSCVIRFIYYILSIIKANKNIQVPELIVGAISTKFISLGRYRIQINTRYNFLNLGLLLNTQNLK